MNTLCNHYKWPGTLWPHVCSVSTWGETSQRRWPEQTMGLNIQALSELLMKPCDAFQFAQCIDNVFNAKSFDFSFTKTILRITHIHVYYQFLYAILFITIKYLHQLNWFEVFFLSLILFSQAIHWGNALLIHTNSMNLKNFMQNKFADISNVMNNLQINL